MTQDQRKRLAQLLAMIGSNHDGEALNAARLANRLLGSTGLSWDELLNGAGKYSEDDMQAAVNAAYNQGLADGASRAKILAQPSQIQPHRERSWIALAREINQDYQDDLTDWEQGFIDSFVSRGWAAPSPKQRAIFQRIANRIGLTCPD